MIPAAHGTEGNHLPSVGVKCRLLPNQLVGLPSHHVKSGGGQLPPAPQKIACGKDNASLFGAANAAQGAAKLALRAFSHLDKHQGTVRFLQNKVNFAATPARRSIIAL